MRPPRIARVSSSPNLSLPRTFQAELALASDAARRAGRLQMERYGQLERIEHKGEHDVVTEVDHLSEELILSAIREAFPDDSSLSEEAGGYRLERRADGADTPKGRQASGSPLPPPVTDRVWIVDPLDGTVNYANAIPLFCVSIGLAVDGRPAVGVVYDPARDELFTAVAGEGARLDGQPIGHRPKEKLSDCVVSLALPYRGWARRAQRIRRRIRVSRSLGSASLSLAYVANGRFDAFVQVRGLSNWDIAAAGLIAAEGGAAVTDETGGPWFDLARKSRGVGTIAAPPLHHAPLLELLNAAA